MNFILYLQQAKMCSSESCILCTICRREGEWFGLIQVTRQEWENQGGE